jgi:predicted HicB family RNase H-like nuclease
MYSMCRAVQYQGTNTSLTYNTEMKAESGESKQQLGVRIDSSLVVETKVLAARQRKRLNELVEEALRDLLKKYREKK